MTDLPSLSLDEAIARVESMSDLAPQEQGTADSRDGRVYVTTSELVTAVKVALVTGRPLLLGGEPGTGKSSFAAYVARNLGVAYYEFIALDESRSTDLLWSMDAVRRLADAQVQRLADDTEAVSYARYINPGPFWWALDPDSAQRRGLSPDAFRDSGLRLATDPAVDLGVAPEYAGAVVLIDEIDKADNAFSSGLLVPLGARQFEVPPLGASIRTSQGWTPLVILSTNNERDLSPAFLRRCVMLALPEPDAERLIAIADRHLPAARRSPELMEAVQMLATTVVQEGEHVSSAEFLDLVRVLSETPGPDIESEEWKLIRRLVLDKRSIRQDRYAGR